MFGSHQDKNSLESLQERQNVAATPQQSTPQDERFSASKEDSGPLLQRNKSSSASDPTVHREHTGLRCSRRPSVLRHGLMAEDSKDRPSDATSPGGAISWEGAISGMRSDCGGHMHPRPRLCQEKPLFWTWPCRAQRARLVRKPGNLGTLQAQTAVLFGTSCDWQAQWFW